MWLRRFHAPIYYAKQATSLITGLIAFAFSLLEPGNKILSVRHGKTVTERLGPRVAVFCHFDAHGRIRDHTRAYLDALVAEGLDLVFASNSRVRAPDLDWIGNRAARIILRRNVGYDFAAWRDALATTGLPNTETRFLLIANDSVYGPLRPLGKVLAEIDFDQADVWSATDSWQHRFHLQSYFVAFGPRALRHEAFGRFWHSVRNIRSKWWIVMKYEIGMSHVFIAAGLRCRALWPYTQSIEVLRDDACRQTGHKSGAGNDDTCAASFAAGVQDCEKPFAIALRGSAERILRAASRRIPLNPTADLWHMLILCGCPFLKRELLLTNPSRVPDLAAWSSLVAAIDKEGHDLIVRDLEISLKNRSP